MEAGAALGLTEDELCLLIPNPNTNAPINRETLRKHFVAELRGGHVKANLKVGAGLFTNATTPNAIHPGGNPICQMFWLKCRLRWRQNPEADAPMPTAPIEETEEFTLEDARRVAFWLELAGRRKPALRALPEPTPIPARKREVA